MPWPTVIACSFSMNTTTREIEQKQARVTHLKTFIAENLPLANQDLDAGFFMSGAAKLRLCGLYAEEIATLLTSIMQLELRLDRERHQQTYLFAGVAPAL